MGRKCSPAGTGDSPSGVGDTCLKLICPPLSPATGNAVPYFQPAGSLSDATIGISSVCFPGPYRTTWFQLSMLSCVVADAPDEKPSGGAGITKSSFASSVLTPGGTLT